MTMHVTRERGLAQLRRVVNRLARSLPKKRTGYFFIWSRFLLERFEQFTRPARPAGGVEAVRLDELSARVTGSSVRRAGVADGRRGGPPRLGAACRSCVGAPIRARDAARPRSRGDSWRRCLRRTRAVRSGPRWCAGGRKLVVARRRRNIALAGGRSVGGRVGGARRRVDEHVDRSVQLRPLPPAERAAPGSRWSTWSAAPSRSRPRCSRAPRSSSPRTVPRSRISCSRAGTVAIELIGTNTVSDIYAFLALASRARLPDDPGNRTRAPASLVDVADRRRHRRRARTRASTP